MASMVRRVAACVAVGGLALALSAGSTAADDKEKVYKINEIMKRHTGSKSLLKGITAQVKAGDWEGAQDGAKLFKAFGESLGKNSPEKGDAASWKKLADAYKENTKAVYEAAEKKDAKEVTANLGKIQKSCKACHDSHK